eukprot:4547495-Prymnesium_polylepis.2
MPYEATGCAAPARAASPPDLQLTGAARQHVAPLALPQPQPLQLAPAPECRRRRCHLTPSAALRRR